MFHHLIMLSSLIYYYFFNSLFQCVYYVRIRLRNELRVFVFFKYFSGNRGYRIFFRTPCITGNFIWFNRFLFLTKTEENDWLN